jgi:hypothetical protein
MKHYLDLSTDELRALYIVIPHDHPFECLKETVAKMERLLEIAKQADEANGITGQVWGEDAFIK